MASECLSHEKRQECQSFLTLLLEDEEFKTCLFHPSCDILGEEDVEGEIIDILFRFLRKKNCPIVLLAPLISLSRCRFLKQDLTPFNLGNHVRNNVAESSVSELSTMLFETFKMVCTEVEKDLSMLALKELRQKSHVNVHAIRNTRRKMEDQHCYYEDINTLFGFNEIIQGQSMFAVFDGHGGAEAANYAASQLLCELKSCENLLPDPSEALKNAVMKIDTKYLEKAREENLKSGSTAVIVLIQGVNLTVAWLGDSQVVLCKNGQAIQLMEPHKPDREDERARIEALGGCVMFFNGWRVNGSLAVSRAIGDIDQKPYISSEPDVEEYEMEGDEEFLILACDGLWDTVEELEAVECVQKCISDGQRDHAAETLVTLAKEKRSMDNITVMVVYLDFHKAAPSTS